MSRTALLLMDVQKANVTRVADGYIDRAKAALEAARRWDVTVIHIAIQVRADHADIAPQNRIFGALPAGTYTAGDADAAIHPDAAPVDGEIVITKNRVSAFAGNNLRQILDAQGIDHLVLGGLATSGVVLATAIQAFDLDYRLAVLSDASADPQAEVHDMLIEHVLEHRADVLTVDEWAARLSSAS